MVRHKTVFQPKWNLAVLNNCRLFPLWELNGKIILPLIIYQHQCFSFVSPLCVSIQPWVLLWMFAVPTANPSIKKSLNLLFLSNKAHMHMCTDSHREQFLCVSRAAEERCTETHQALDKPRIPPNSTYMFQCARKQQILDSQWEARGTEQLRSLYFQRILGDPRPAHWMSRLPAICAPISGNKYQYNMRVSLLG